LGEGGWSGRAGRRVAEGVGHFGVVGGGDEGRGESWGIHHFTTVVISIVQAGRTMKDTMVE